MSKQIRFKEALISISVDGVPQDGAMRKIIEFKLSPEVKKSKVRYAGEKRHTPDLDVMGYTGTFQTHSPDHRWWSQLWDKIQIADEVGAAPPEITATVTYAYRNGQDSSISLHGEMVLVLDSQDHKTDDYITQSWSFDCQFASQT